MTRCRRRACPHAAGHPRARDPPTNRSSRRARRRRRRWRQWSPRCGRLADSIRICTVVAIGAASSWQARRQSPRQKRIWERFTARRKARALTFCASSAVREARRCLPHPSTTAIAPYSRSETWPRPPTLSAADAMICTAQSIEILLCSSLIHTNPAWFVQPSARSCRTCIANALDGAAVPAPVLAELHFPDSVRPPYQHWGIP